MKSKAEAGDQAGPDKSLPDTIRQDAEIHAAALKQQRALKIHSACLLFPDMPADQFELLKADIALNGVLEPVKLWDGQLIDGRHRWRACQELGVACPEWPLHPDEMEGITPIQFVVAMNLPRRHLTASQRAALAAEYALPQYRELAAKRQKTSRFDGGGNVSTTAANSIKSVLDRVPKKARDRAGETFKVSGRSVAKAAKLRETDPEAFEKVKAGTRSLDGKAPEAPLDGNRQPVVRESLWPAFETRAKLVEARNLLIRANKLVKAVIGTPGGEHIVPAETTIRIGATRERIAENTPFIACPACDAVRSETCDRCTSRGWITKSEAADGAGGEP